MKLLDTPAYPNIIQDYARTFERQKEMSGRVDVWVSSHAPQFRLRDKYKPGDSYDPNRFVDPMGYLQMVQRVEQAYLDQLRRERQGK